jgi:hypothetical protein
VRSTWEGADEVAHAIARALVPRGKRWENEWGVPDWPRTRTHINGSYYKSDVVVEFEDGFQYRLRYDIDPDDFMLLSTSVRDEIRFYGGLWRPAHMDEKKHEQVLEALFGEEKDARRAAFREAFTTHAFPAVL